MGNDSLSWIPTALDVQLASISDHHLAILGIIIAILGILVTLYIGVPYVKKLNFENKKDLDHAIEANAQITAQAIAQSEARLERCINELIPVSSQGKASSFCKGVEEDAKRLQSAASNYDRGLSKAMLGDLEGAEAEFSEAIDMDRPVLSKSYFQRGNTRYLQKKFKDSCRDYSEAIKINPKFAEACSNKGSALAELGRYDDAIEAYEQAIEINPKYAEAWYNKGNALDKLGRYDDAIEAYERAIEINPKYAEAWYNKGISLGKLGHPEDALEACNKAIEINPLLAAEAWSDKGLALLELGHPEDALEACNKAIEINPKYAIAWNNKGIVLLTLGHCQWQNKIPQLWQ